MQLSNPHQCVLNFVNSLFGLKFGNILHYLLKIVVSFSCLYGIFLAVDILVESFCCRLQKCNACQHQI